MTTSYSNTGGAGNRAGVITVTCRTNLFAVDATALVGLINGNTTENTWFFTAAVADGWMKFDFGVGHAKIIDGFRWYQSNNTNHGTWKWYSSDDDSTYTARGAAVTLAGPAGGGYTEFTEPAGNTVGARYWMLQQESSTTSAGPFLREIEFRIQEGAPTFIAHQVTAAPTNAFTFSATTKRMVQSKTLSLPTQAFAFVPTRHLVSAKTLPVPDQLMGFATVRGLVQSKTLPAPSQQFRINIIGLHSLQTVNLLPVSTMTVRHGAGSGRRPITTGDVTIEARPRQAI